tara:strand:- start:584 stop:1450 length:867 start_codon:yes stop_codon:yes gene_type:complete
MSYIGQQLPDNVFGAYTVDTFTGDGSATTFTLSEAPTSESALIVVVDNVIQQPTVNFTVSGTTLTIVGTAILSGIKGYAIHTQGKIPIGTASAVDLNGASDGIILDADADTTISANTDDEMLLKTAGNTGVKIDANGHVNQPLQPAFRVSNGTQNDVAINSNVTILFSSEIYDKNSDFNTGTYTFTAPVAGRYLFAVTIVALNVDSAISYAQAKLVTSNHTTKIQTLESGADHFNEDAAYYQFHNTVIEEMDANDTAYVQIRIQGGAAQTDIDSDSNTGTLFHGYLLG